MNSYEAVISVTFVIEIFDALPLESPDSSRHLKGWERNQFASARRDSYHRRCKRLILFH
jgi:DNA-binding MarR family transcriptional regulator